MNDPVYAAVPLFNAENESLCLCSICDVRPLIFNNRAALIKLTDPFFLISG